MDEKGLTEQFERGLEALLDGAALRMNLPRTPPTDAAAR